MTDPHLIVDIPAMLAGYLECALWSSTAEDGVPLDADFFETDFTPESQAAAREDCFDFVAQCAAQGLGFSGLESSAIGHDLWLTRNHHGAGFWDRGLGALGDRLTSIANDMGSRDVVETGSGQLVIE